MARYLCNLNSAPLLSVIKIVRTLAIPKVVLLLVPPANQWICVTSNIRGKQISKLLVSLANSTSLELNSVNFGSYCI